VETEKNKEFATLIGRRLRAAYVTSSPDALPETIERPLGLLREAEARARRGASLDPSSDGGAQPQPAPADRSTDG